MSAVRSQTLLAACAVAVLAGGAFGCSSSKPSPASPPPQALWGDMKPVVSVKEIMKYMIDPASDHIFNSVSTVIDPKGKIIETEPKTEEDWEKLRIGAVTIAEGVYLLKVPRPFTPPGDENHSGPGGSELTPAEITAKVQRDPVEWNARIEALRNVGLQVIEIAKTKNTKELWDASENLDEACEACHRAYWYPKEDSEFYRTLDKQLRDIPNPKFGGRASAPPR